MTGMRLVKYVAIPAGIGGPGYYLLKNSALESPAGRDLKKAEALKIHGPEVNRGKTYLERVYRDYHQGRINQKEFLANVDEYVLSGIKKLYGLKTSTLGRDKKPRPDLIPLHLRLSGPGRKEFHIRKLSKDEAKAIRHATRIMGKDPQKKKKYPFQHSVITYKKPRPPYNDRGPEFSWSPTLGSAIFYPES